MDNNHPSATTRLHDIVRFPWWTSPNLLMLLSLAVVLYVIVAVDDAQYKRWGTPRYVTTVEAVEIGAVIIAVLLGIVVGMVLGRRTKQSYFQETELFLRTRILTVLFYFFVLLTLAGYVIWIVKASQNGATITAVMATLRGDPGAVSELKEVAQPEAGLTTLTQFGVLVVVLGIVRARVTGKSATILVWLVIMLSLLRFFLYAERIAFLEVAVPAMMVLVSLWPPNSRYPRTRKFMIAIAPVLLAALAFGLFALGEYFRSWAFVREESEQSFTEFIVSRFLSYYATATNNGVLYGRLADEHNLNQTAFYILYNLPGSPLGNGDVAGTEFNRWWGLQLELFANPSLTNIGTVFPLIGEISLVTVLFLFFIQALVFALLYSKAKNGHFISMLVIPVFCFASLELPRISYLLLGRSAPIFLGVIVVWFVFDIWRACGCGRAPEESVSTSRPPRHRKASGEDVAPDVPDRYQAVFRE